MTDWLPGDLRVQIHPSGLSVTCRYCGRCGAIIPLTLKELHDDFHGRAPFDPAGEPMHGHPPADMPPEVSCS